MVIYIDPYLSDSLLMEKGDTYIRQVPIREEDLTTHVDVLILTHLHGDHTDFPTIDRLAAHNPKMAVMAPLIVTGVCLVMMWLSRRTIYPWIISIFSLVLPWLIWITNVFPA